jgi:hypothetical protein
MATIPEIDNRNPLTLTYADDMNESSAAIMITLATFEIDRHF